MRRPKKGLDVNKEGMNHLRGDILTLPPPFK